MGAHRELFWHIDAQWIFYLISIPIVFFVIGSFVVYLYIWLKLSKNEGIKGSTKALKVTILDVFLQKRLLKGQFAAGLMHLLIFWGFLLLTIATALLSIHEHIHSFLTGKIYIIFSLVTEAAGLMLLAGCLLALIRRYVQKVPRLEHKFEDALIPIWIAIIVISGFFLEALRIACTPASSRHFSFVGLWISGFLKGTSAEPTYPYLWWAHTFISLGFLAIIPFTKMFHAIGAPIAIYMQNLPTPAPSDTDQDQDVDIESEAFDYNEFTETDEDRSILVKDLDLPTMAFLDSCMRCGRCVEVCPSTGVGEPYAPRDFVQAMRSLIWQTYSPFGDIRFLKRPNKEMLERLWYCTTCRACLEVCPIYGPTFQLVLSQRELSIEEGTSKRKSWVG
ncbi:MAG: (Fe-S)-binding protein [Deltaproteobacteria bacterium]|nr:(Fe-S)-binding protein [Deltaproteobacteria bacterium]